MPTCSLNPHQVEALCAEAGVEVVRAGRHELNLMSQDRPHQVRRGHCLGGWVWAGGSGVCCGHTWSGIDTDRRGNG